MFQWRRPTFLLIAFSCLATANAKVVSNQSQDVYTVSGIQVDATAGDAVTARSEALLVGQRDGLDRLLRRLVPTADHGRLPAAASLPVERYVQNFQIGDEQLSATRYLAQLTVAFSPNAIRDLLQSQGLPFTQVASAPLVILPLYDDPLAPALWLEGNPWWAAWDQAMDRERLVRLQLPLGDLEDMGALSIEQARAGDGGALARLAQRYSAEDSLVLTATPIPSANPADGVTVRIVGSRAGEGTGVVPSFELRSLPGQPIEVALAEAVRRVQDSLDERWKSSHQLRLDQGGFLLVNVPIGGLSDWVSIDQGLTQLEEVSQIEVTSFARNRVQAQIHYVGDQASLEQALARLGLTLSQEGESWLLHPIATSPRPGAPPNGISTPS